MTVESEQVSASSKRSGVRWRRLLLAMLLLAVGAATAAYAWRGRREEPPQPPQVNLAGVEPRVAKVIEAMRAKVLREPRSAEAWGLFGKVLLAHGYGDDSVG